MCARTGRHVQGGRQGCGLVVGCPLSHGWCPFVGRLVGSLGQCFACAAGEFSGSGHVAALVDGQGRAQRGDGLAGAVGGHALYQRSFSPDVSSRNWCLILKCRVAPGATIEETSADQDEQFEGCLSFFDVRGRVPRALSIVVAHDDLDGSTRLSRFTHGMARLVAHELDHLCGVLYRERMRPGVLPIPVEEYRGTGLIYSCQASAQADRLWRHQVHEARGLSGAERGAGQ